MKQFKVENVTIVKLSEEEIPAIEAIASRALASTYDAYHAADEELPEEDEDVDQPDPQFYGERGAAYKIIVDDDVVGGIFLSFELPLKSATISLFGLLDGKQGRGIGQKVWKKIEEIHSDIQIWRLHTPAYALRNIAFYVNQCGFVVYHITKGSERFDWHMFRLKKEMPGTSIE